MKTKNNSYAKFGMIVSIVCIVFGLLMLFGVFSNTSYQYDNDYIYYDYGFASFGGDFYTYSNNNAALAAIASKKAANNLDGIGEFLSTACGGFFVIFGLMSLCFFGMKMKEQEPVVECVPTVPDGEQTEDPQRVEEEKQETEEEKQED